MEVHEAAKLFPMLPEDKLNELAEDIRVKGLLQPLITYKGQLLDGRNRWEACTRIGKMPETQEYNGDDPIGYVVSANIQRRHLTTSERAILGKQLVGLYEEENKTRLHEAQQRGRATRSERARAARMGKLDKLDNGADPAWTPVKSPESNREARTRESVERAAKLVDVGASAIKAAKKLEEEAPELYEEVEAGRLGVYRAAGILRTSKKAEPEPKKQPNSKYTKEFGVSREASARRKLSSVISYLKTASEELEGVDFAGVVTEEEKRSFKSSLTKLRRVYNSLEDNNA